MPISSASQARLIELNQAAVTTIKHNLEFTRLKDNGEVIHSDAFVYLKRPVDQGFDYIYVAPPQYKNLWQKAMLGIDANPGWLSTDAWVIVQIDPVEYEKLALTNLNEFDQRRYGSTLLIFYEIKTG